VAVDFSEPARGARFAERDAYAPLQCRLLLLVLTTAVHLLLHARGLDPSLEAFSRLAWSAGG
jgi:hypothetical protein